MNLRAKLLNGGRVPREVVDITVTDPTTGETEVIHVECRGLSAEARGRLMTTSMIKVGDESDDGEQEERVDLSKISPELVIEGAFDPTSGEPIFQAADRDAVGALSASFLDPIITKVSQLTGLSKAASKVMEGNSAPTTTSASASLSPAS